MSSYETKIIQGVNCWKARSIYYVMGILSSFGCLTLTMLQLFWALPSWEHRETVEILFSFSLIYLVYAIMIVRSFCVPTPTITSETRLMGEDKWIDINLIYMFGMFQLTYAINSVLFSIYLLAIFTGGIAAKQLNSPFPDLSIRQVAVTIWWGCLSGFLGYQQPFWPYFFFFVLVTASSFFI